MKKLSRRQLLKNVATVVPAVAFGGLLFRTADDSEKLKSSQSDNIKLGIGTKTPIATLCVTVDNQGCYIPMY